MRVPSCHDLQRLKVPLRSIKLVELEIRYFLWWTETKFIFKNGLSLSLLVYDTPPFASGGGSLLRSYHLSPDFLVFVSPEPDLPRLLQSFLREESIEGRNFQWVLHDRCRIWTFGTAKWNQYFNERDGRDLDFHSNRNKFRCQLNPPTHSFYLQH